MEAAASQVDRAGACPRCGGTISVPTPAPTILTCPACAQRCLVLLPDAGAGATEGDEPLELVAYRADERPGTPDARVLKRIVLAGLIAAAVVATLLVLAFAGLLVAMLMQEVSGARPGSALAELVDASPDTVLVTCILLLALMVLALVVGVFRRVAAGRRS
jgi:hypothetical protein